MYRITKNSIKNSDEGFTLVELLVAIAIIGIISVIAVRSLYDIVTLRSKQQTIEDTGDSIRTLTRLMTKSVIEAQKVNVINTQEIQITGEVSCETIKFDSGTGSVLHAIETGSSCTPPNTGFTPVTGDDLAITNFNLSPVGVGARVITLEIEGMYKNSLGDHPVKYKTTVTPRI